MSFTDRAEAGLPLAGKPKLSLVRGFDLLKPHMLPGEVDNLRMGGGTALAMRWGHRLSTDVDLAMDKPAHAAFLRRVRGNLLPVLKALREQRKIRHYRLSGSFLGWEFTESGPISLSASQMGRNCEGVEAETGIGLAVTKAILKGKLLGRVLRNGKLLSRDGYDLCCAFRHDKEAWDAVMEEAEAEHPDELVSICNRIENVGKRIIVGRPIVNAAYPDLARDPWGFFVRLVRNMEIDFDAEPPSGPILG